MNSEPTPLTTPPFQPVLSYSCLCRGRGQRPRHLSSSDELQPNGRETVVVLTGPGADHPQVKKKKKIAKVLNANPFIYFVLKY